MGLAFMKRTGGYKAGVILLFIAMIIFIAGFSGPYWSTYDVPDAGRTDRSLYEGLWVYCASGGRLSSPCETFDFDVIGGWLHAVRALEALCLVLLIGACTYAIIFSFCRSEPEPCYRILELVVGLGGLLGLIGVIVYAAIRKQKTNMYTFSAELGFRLPERGNAYEYDWALYLAGLGSGAAIIAAILIGVFNEGEEDFSDVDYETKSDYSSHSGGYPRHAYGYPRHGAGYARSEDSDGGHSHRNKAFVRNGYEGDHNRNDYDKPWDTADITIGSRDDDGRRHEKRDYRSRDRDRSRDSDEFSHDTDARRHEKRDYRNRDRDRSRDSDDLSRHSSDRLDDNRDERRSNRSHSRDRENANRYDRDRRPDRRDHSYDDRDNSRRYDDDYKSPGKRDDRYDDDRDNSRRHDDDYRSPGRRDYRYDDDRDNSRRHDDDRTRRDDDHRRHDRRDNRYDDRRHEDDYRQHDDRNDSRRDESYNSGDDRKRREPRDTRPNDANVTRDENNHSADNIQDDADSRSGEGRRRRRRRRSRRNSGHEDEQPRHDAEQPRHDDAEQPRHDHEQPRQSENRVPDEGKRERNERYTPPKAGYDSSHRSKLESETTV